MSAIYRFGFEFGNVPDGVTINNGRYFWIGREGNCSLYGNYPTVTCSLEKTNNVRGSLWALSFNHNLDDCEHPFVNGFVSFGSVSLKCIGSGDYAISHSGSNLVTLTGIPFHRGEWVPIRFQIDLDTDYVRFEVKGIPIEANIPHSNTGWSSVTIGGFGGTGLLEDIAINNGAGSLDTEIPNSVACMPAFFTGNGSSNDFTNYGTIPNFGKQFNNYADGISPYYCPSNNQILMGGRYGPGQNPIKYSPENGDVTKWFNSPLITGKLSVNRICYVPSRDTVIAATGHGFADTVTFIEVDLDGNVIKNNIFSALIDFHSIQATIATPPAYYHAKTNKVYFSRCAWNSSTPSTLRYLDCNSFTTGEISLLSPIDAFLNSICFAIDPFHDTMIYKSVGSAGFNMCGLDLYNLNEINYSIINGGISTPVGTSTAILCLLPDLNSGIFVASSTSAYYIINLSSTGVKTIPLASSVGTTHVLGYSKLSKTISLQFFPSITIVSGLTDLNKITSTNRRTINFPLDHSNFPNNKNFYASYCGYNDSTYIVADNNDLYSIQHCTKNNLNINYGSYQFSQFNDYGDVRTSITGHKSNYLTIQFTGTNYEGTNVFVKARKLTANNVGLYAGINNGADNISLKSSLLSSSNITDVKTSQFYTTGDAKYSISEANQIQSYIEYSGTSS